MNVNLTSDLEKLIEKKVKTGRYNSANEVAAVYAYRVMARRLRCPSQQRFANGAFERWKATKVGFLDDFKGGALGYL